MSKCEICKNSDSFPEKVPCYKCNNSSISNKNDYFTPRTRYDRIMADMTDEKYAKTLAFSFRCEHCPSMKGCPKFVIRNTKECVETLKDWLNEVEE